MNGTTQVNIKTRERLGLDTICQWCDEKVTDEFAILYYIPNHTFFAHTDCFTIHVKQNIICNEFIIIVD